MRRRRSRLFLARPAARLRRLLCHACRAGLAGRRSQPLRQPTRARHAGRPSHRDLPVLADLLRQVAAVSRRGHPAGLPLLDPAGLAVVDPAGLARLLLS